MRLCVRSAVLCLGVASLGCPGTSPSPTPAADGSQAQAAAPSAEPSPPRQGMGKHYDEELATLRQRMAAQIQRTEKVEGYTTWQAAAETALQIARMTGDYRDFKTAEDTVAKAFKIDFASKQEHGAYFSRARFNYHLHRLDRIDADVERARSRAMVGGSKAVAALEVFEGNVAMQRGQFDVAQAHWTKADALVTDAAKLAWALWAFKTADFDTAETLYRSLADNYHGREGEGAAWLDLVQGIMDLDRGRYDDALSHLDDADADLSGYWLVDEHRAEITALQGDLPRAEAMYREIIARTNNPEFMDALAAILKQTDRVDEAQAFINDATARFEDQMALFPEAAYGHALGHFLDFGPPDRALDLARKNHQVRPNVEAKMLLAQAELAMGNVDAAKAMIDAAVATPWSTADLHYTAFEVYTASGDTALATAQLAKAKAINPRIAD